MRFVSSRSTVRTLQTRLACAPRQRSKPFDSRRFRYFAEITGAGMLMACFFALAIFG
jgi:hypothetical protein